jgi:hypothetical protein
MKLLEDKQSKAERRKHPLNLPSVIAVMTEVKMRAWMKELYVIEIAIRQTFDI